MAETRGVAVGVEKSQWIEDIIWRWMWLMRTEESSMTMTSYDLGYWVNYGTTTFDGQECKNRFRGENQEFVLSTLTL